MSQDSSNQTASGRDVFVSYASQDVAIADAIVRATNGRWKIGDSRAGGASMSVSWPRAFPGGRETAGRSVSRTQPTD